MDLQKNSYRKSNKTSRFVTSLLLFLAVVAGVFIENQTAKNIDPPPATPDNSSMVVTANNTSNYKTAKEALEALEVKGRAPKTGYKRTQFGNGWAKSDTCDVRNKILARDLTNLLYEINSCIVISGTLQDPYTGKTLPFVRGQDTSDDIQIDHVVALSDAWQKGAQLLTPELRLQFANDGLNLLAVEGAANQIKSDGDAATWLPAYKPIRCSYVARQISVKLKYSLWVTSAEKAAIAKVLEDCPEQKLST